MKKKVILNIESVYTANAFQVGTDYFVAAGSETKPEVFLYNLTNDSSEFVNDCPGGVMSFIPVPSKPNLFFSIMGLFPPFIGAEAGVFMHERKNEKWESTKAMNLPFAHRCEIVSRNGKNYLFAASVSTYKANPQDWSNPGEIHLVELEDQVELPLKSTIIENNLTRNHGMLRANIGGNEVVCISGVEGIFYFDFNENGEWVKKSIFDREVSEFCFVDFDGDGQDELVTIEPFHGETLNVYKKIQGKWELKFRDSLLFGHGLNGGTFKGEPIVVVGNRAGTLSLDVLKCKNMATGEFSRESIETAVGPTQTQVFTAGGTDYILSSNQKKNEVALYY